MKGIALASLLMAALFSGAFTSSRESDKQVYVVDIYNNDGTLQQTIFTRSLPVRDNSIKNSRLSKCFMCKEMESNEKVTFEGDVMFEEGSKNALELANRALDNHLRVVWVSNITNEYNAQCEGLKCYEE